jgi:uncharacterized membrane protein YccC
VTRRPAATSRSNRDRLYGLLLVVVAGIFVLILLLPTVGVPLGVACGVGSLLLQVINGRKSAPDGSR